MGADDPDKSLGFIQEPVGLPYKQVRLPYEAVIVRLFYASRHSALVLCCLTGSLNYEEIVHI